MFKNLFKSGEAMKRMKKRRKEITYLQPLKNTDIHMSVWILYFVILYFK